MSGDLRYAVQLHRATSTHFDLRFEAGGVLLSWAVPKGPTLDPSRRRTAFHVEDHPLDYLLFEGVIPRGSYGAGDVTVWDTGTYRLRRGTDARASVEAGDLHVALLGERLRGGFTLVRRGPPGDREQWLLLKKRDEYAEAGWEPLDHPRSVLTGRTNDEVRAAADRLWRPDLPADRAEVRLRPSAEEVSDAVAALDALGRRGTWQVFGRSLRVEDLDAALLPGRGGEPPVTRRELLRYAVRVAPTVAPHLAGRATSLRSRPDDPGARRGRLARRAPAWVTAWDDPDAGPGETAGLALLDEPAAVVWATRVGALEWRASASRIDRPDRPTYAMFELDPGGGLRWEEVLVLARLHRTALEHLGVAAHPKVTGGRGIEIRVPVAGRYTSEETRAWVDQVSRTVGRAVPDLVGWRWRAADRHGPVAPYSPRAAPGAPVSAPLAWEELDDPTLRPDGFTVRDVLDRLEERGDLFAGVLTGAQRLPTVS